MHLNDAFLSEQLKILRHDLGAAMAEHFAEEALGCRDVLNDVGTELKAVNEYQRADFSQIIRANCARVLQSLRSIEEYSKLIRPESSPQFEAIRYRVYAAEKAVAGMASSRRRFESACLYVLTDCRASSNEFEKLVKDLIDAEVDLIQLRDKRFDDRQLIEAGKSLTQWTQGANTRWIMNDRPDLAVICQADGVHVGQTDMSVPEARRIVGTEKIVGVSTHVFQQATEAVMNAADYIGVGPVFQSQTKSFEKFAESEFVSRVMSEVSLPAFAIGGIGLSNLEKVVELGVRRIAVSGSIVGATDPKQAAKELKRRLLVAWRSSPACPPHK